MIEISVSKCSKVTFTVVISTDKFISNIYKSQGVRSCFMGIQNGNMVELLVFSLRAIEKDLLPVAAVAGITRRSLQICTISLIIAC